MPGLLVAAMVACAASVDDVGSDPVDLADDSEPGVVDTPGEVEDPVTFAIIGDYGNGGPSELSVANLVNQWDAQFIITLGDNNYPDGEESTIDAHVGAFYSDWIHPYTGQYGTGADENRFFPSPGNHDWNTGTLQPYLDYFSLPGNERYYTFTRGPVAFFAVDSDAHEPDGITADSVQAAWLQQGLQASTSPFKVVYMHHPPCSSADHGNSTALQWPFHAWGADVVLAGHDHSYEKLVVSGDLYVVNGAGGAGLRDFPNQVAGSEVGFEASWGAQYVTATERELRMRFYAVNGDLIDDFTMIAGEDFEPSGSPLIASGALWSYKDDGVLQAQWASSGFDDQGWSEGASPLGYSDEVATEVSFGADNSNKHPVTWFRHGFSVSDASVVSSMLMRVARDDGAVVYLNGAEVWRSNVREGTLDASTTAASRVGMWFETAFISTRVSTDALVDGENVLAVAVVQRDGQSSDLFFDLELFAGGAR